jgi:phospholipase C
MKPVQVFLIMVVLVVSLLAGAGLLAGQPGRTIKHVVVVMQENRTFDNYFWTYPGQAGYNASLCMPLNPVNPSSGCVRPFLASSAVTKVDLPHDAAASKIAFAGGSMDGFLPAAYGDRDTMSYFDNGSIPALWFFAEHYVLADRFFTSALSYSQPNHWYMIAGNAPAVSMVSFAPEEKASCYNANTGAITMATCKYVAQAQSIRTMADALTSSGISWKYYDIGIPGGATLAKAISGDCKGCTAFSYWNPLEAKNSTYTDFSYTESMAPRSQIFDDLKQGTLPAVSWVIPSGPISDHAPANVTLGSWWVADVVDSVMASRYWRSTVIVVLWDDYGGYFDTVKLPSVDSNGLSFRCPAIVISPYARAGHLDHTVYDFESTLRFIEWLYNLPPLTQRDATANNLLSALNLDQAPVAAFPYPLTPKQLAIIQPFILETGKDTPNPSGIGPLASSAAFIDNNPD